jgi:hypothetical protein
MVMINPYELKTLCEVRQIGVVGLEVSHDDYLATRILLVKKGNYWLCCCGVLHDRGDADIPYSVTNGV